MNLYLNRYSLRLYEYFILNCNIYYLVDWWLSQSYHTIPVTLTLIIPSFQLAWQTEYAQCNYLWVNRQEFNVFYSITNEVCNISLYWKTELSESEVHLKSTKCIYIVPKYYFKFILRIQTSNYSDIITFISQTIVNKKRSYSKINTWNKNNEELQRKLPKF